MRKRMVAWCAAVALGLFGGMMLASSPAQATEELVQRSPVKIDRSYAPCGPTKLTTYANAYIVASVDGDEPEVSESLGAPVEIGPFPEPKVVYWRLFGGPERDNDYPLWTGHPATGSGLSNSEFKDAINEYGDLVGGFDWTTHGRETLATNGNPFIGAYQWKSFRLKGCVTPEEPVSTALECATSDAPTIAGTVEIPATEGVQYLLNGEPIEAGVHDLPPGDYTVTAEPKPGYAFPKEPEFGIEWTFTLGAINGCPGTPGDRGEPGTPGEPGPSGAPGTDGQAGTADELPKTGSKLLWLASGGVSLLVAGAGLLGVSRLRIPGLRLR